MDPSRVSHLLPRQSSESTSDHFLDLISNPFSQEIQSDAFLASLTTSVLFTLIVALIFCVLRPHNTVVYAPRSRHADDKHAPPPVGKGWFAWVKPVIKTKEQEIVEKVGLDATIFLRFTRMCRDIFLVLSVLGCGILIPVNVVGGHATYSRWGSVTTFSKMTPQFMFGRIYWALVVCSYIFNVVICYFLWRNYRVVTRLRRDYFESPEYQASLHARTLMVRDIPPPLRTDEGIIKIVNEIKSTEDSPRGAVGRNVKDLPDLIEEHEELVRDLEKYLAKYLKNPNKLPAKRPTCKPSNNDRAHAGNKQVDAIDYLTSRIRELEVQIREVRESLDKRNAMPYGFASYESIEEAHNVAYVGRKKHPEGSTVTLAPRPHDLIWNNLPLSTKERRWKSIMNNVWVGLLTIVWIAPNVLIAVFLSNLSNLGSLWPAFEKSLRANPKWWAVVQGVLSPAITSLFYFYLPAIFRRLQIHAGDLTKTSRERHVTHRLYSFFVFNNLIVFSIFSAIWKYVADVIAARHNGNSSVLDALEKADLFTSLMLALCNVSPFWVSWLLQRNLGAAIDLSQLYNLAWGSFARKFLSPTPRQLIELSAPQPFDYASYYNYFLFYTTIALCFATLQPIVLPVTALYFFLDAYLKKYLVLYVFITKTESGGQFWRILFNRLIFATILSNIVVALLVVARGSWAMLGCMLPLLLLMAAFKWYCARTFDDQIHFYTRGLMKDPESKNHDAKHSRRGDRVAVRFGHPALYKPLMTPMVHAKSQHLLAQVYRGRLDVETDGAGAGAGVTDYSDTYSLSNMAHHRPGKPATSGEAGQPNAPFEIVHEGELDFRNFKDRAEFRAEFGGGGEMYGRAEDIVRPGTPGSFVTLAQGRRERERSESRDSERTRWEPEESEGQGGTVYPAGYHKTPSAGLRGESPVRDYGAADLGVQREDFAGDRGALLRGAAPMGDGDGTGGYSVGTTPGEEEDTSYDYFRRGRR